MDALSELLQTLKVKSAAIGRFSFGAPWSLAMDYGPTHCYSVVEGTCWLADHAGSRTRGRLLEVGDTLVLPRGGCSTLASGPELAPLPLDELWERQGIPGADARESLGVPLRLTAGGNGPHTVLLALAFGLQDDGRHPLLAALPAQLVVRSAESLAAPWTAPALAFLAAESAVGKPGYAATARQLAELLLTSLLCTHLLSSTPPVEGWLQGLTDPQIARALAAMQQQPDVRWTVAALACEAGLSRSVFAERFVACTGLTPKAHLEGWRMHHAREWLAAQQQVGQVAAALGYRSERAFREVFKRHTGMGPRAYAVAHAATASGRRTCAERDLG